eukprot:scaffold321466_cov19-Tisochrysis_lutea.AAC.1
MQNRRGWGGWNGGVRAVVLRAVHAAHRARPPGVRLALHAARYAGLPVALVQLPPLIQVTTPLTIMTVRHTTRCHIWAGKSAVGGACVLERAYGCCSSNRCVVQATALLAYGAGSMVPPVAAQLPAAEAPARAPPPVAGAGGEVAADEGGGSTGGAALRGV